MKRILSLTAVALMGLMLVGGAAAQALPKIGFLVKMPEQSWFQLEWKFAAQAGADLGFEVIQIGTPDGEKVMNAIDNLAAQGAKGFVICTPDTKLGPAIVAKAKSLNLKVLAVDDQFVKADGSPMLDVPYLGISAGKIGETVGTTLAAELKKRGWKAADTGAIRITDNELQTARERVQGATKTLTAAGFDPKMIFDSAQKTTDIEGGFNAANTVITNHPKIKNWLVFAVNDDSVVGGVRALEGQGFKADHIIGVGINGDTTAINEFKKATTTGFFATVLLAAKAHGYQTSQLMFNWITKGVVPPLDTRTAGTLITRDNYVAVFKDSGLELPASN